MAYAYARVRTRTRRDLEMSVKEMKKVKAQAYQMVLKKPGLNTNELFMSVCTGPSIFYWATDLLIQEGLVVKIQRQGCYPEWYPTHEDLLS